MKQPYWLKWAKQLQAISQIGKTYAKDPYDLERYDQIAEISAEMMAQFSEKDAVWIKNLFDMEYGYATPKVDVRGVVVKDGQVLLVREVADQGRWTLPGGWADVNDSAAASVERELFEETGYQVEANHLLAVLDRSKHPYLPPYAYHIYKMYFHCHIVGGAPKISMETSEIAFFDPDALPELSIARVLPNHIKMLVQKIQMEDWQTLFD